MIYRVEKTTDMEGRFSYKVQETKNWISALFGDWIDYEKKNKSLTDAINQIETIYRYSVKKKEIVYKIKK